MNMHLQRLRTISLLVLGAMMLVTFAPRNTYATTPGLQSGDFQSQSFSKTVDFYDYVRQYAKSNGYNTSAIQNEHAYIDANYINVGGFQLFYSGLVNATHNNMNVTIPIQTVFEHFKTPGGKDAITASSFLSLVAFTDNGTIDTHPNYPHLNDSIYASFSLGFDLSAFAGHTAPPLVASSQIIPLTSTDSNHWTWGLNYTNLNAIWWRIYPDQLFPIWDSVFPRAVSQYSQLSFTYSLAIDPTSKTATLTTSYTVGQVTNLYILTNPVHHLNATGTYFLNGTKVSGQTVNQFLQQGGYKLSIVQSHTAILASTSTTDSDGSGASVDNDNSTDVTKTAINTIASGGEKVLSTDFAAKPTYQLYNSTSGTQSTYNVNVRTVNRNAWGGNPVYAVQNIFMGFLPLFVAHVDPALVQAARQGMASFRVAGYLYIISYPTWGGYKIVNDPQFTAFYQPSSNTGLLTIIFVAIAAAAAIGGVSAFLFRKRRATSVTMAGPTVPTQSPGPMPGSTGPTQ